MANWYVIQTRTGEEEKTGLHLVAQGYEVYVPVTLPDKRQRRDGKDRVPLFPSYGFFRAEEGKDSFRPVANTPGVLRIVRLSERVIGGQRCLMPTPVSDELIDGLKQLQTEQGILPTQHDYQRGDRVRITQGPFKGHEAIVSGTARERVDALLEFMGRQEVRLEYGQVEPV